ncbi:MAG TPA: hypothetical protein EYG98_04555, partial [Sulfurovum sp.]|nr:hypothetical protein [Sulfurovum sp.]
MKQILIAIVLLSVSLLAKDMSLAKIVKLSQKGEKITKVFCDEDKFPTAEGTIEQLMEKIKLTRACPKLSKAKLEAVAYFVSNGSMKLTGDHIPVPADAKCPVCGMFTAKYPKWVGLMEVEGKKYYFDGVKDMMKYYIFDVDFPYDRAKITELKVID